MSVALLAPGAAQAQLYTWKDAEGNITIKNTPPPWYNQTESVRGVRVQVLRNGKVIDDTAWPGEKRQDYRNSAAAEEVRRIREAGPAPESSGRPAAGDDN